VLVIRAWLEGEPPQLKARISRTVDPTAANHATATVASAEQIHEEVGRWLDELAAAR
jgi:hypothetical protein